MEDKNINKYNELVSEYFSSEVKWTYEWKIGDNIYCLDWDDKNNRYIYAINCKNVNLYIDIYDALDNIHIDGKTLRQLLIETDLDFDSIL